MRVAAGLLAEFSTSCPLVEYKVSSGFSFPVCGFQVIGRARLALRSNIGLVVDLACEVFRFPVNWNGVPAKQKRNITNVQLKQLSQHSSLELIYHNQLFAYFPGVAQLSISKKQAKHLSLMTVSAEGNQVYETTMKLAK